MRCIPHDGAGALTVDGYPSVTELLPPRDTGRDLPALDIARPTLEVVFDGGISANVHGRQRHVQLAWNSELPWVHLQVAQASPLGVFGEEADSAQPLQRDRLAEHALTVECDRYAVTRLHQQERVRPIVRALLAAHCDSLPGPPVAATEAQFPVSQLYCVGAFEVVAPE